MGDKKHLKKEFSDMSFKGLINKTLDKFKEGLPEKVATNDGIDENYPEESDIIDKNTYNNPTEDNCNMPELFKRANKLIKEYGEQNVYFGKTSNPFNRMTGKNMKINEQFKELGLIEENRSFPPHDKPHLENNYKKMFILCVVQNKADVDRIEKALINNTWDSNRNNTKGGEGPDGGKPYFIYGVVHENGIKKSA